MAASAPPTGQTAASLPVRAVRFQRVEAGAGTALMRVTLAIGDRTIADVAGARLVVADRGRVLRRAALPAPLPAGGETLTLGFAVTATAIPLGLWLARDWIALPDAGDAARRELELQLRTARARLEVAGNVRALAETRRDEALRAAARAEAAAHDASARAEALARRASADHGPLGSRRAGAGAAALGCAAVLFAILAWPARNGDGVQHVGDVVAARAEAEPVRAPRTAAGAADRLAARVGIPADYLTLYRRAAARYGLDWTRLAAVGAIESGHGRAQIAGVVAGTNAQGASGPAQFLSGTWERFGLDGNGDGRRNPHEPADAIPAMASYLRASGAPQDWRAALRSYNHSDAYVTAVEGLAARLRSDAT